MFLVEDAGVGDETIIDIAVNTSQIVHAVSAVGSAAGGNAGNIGLSLDFTCSTEIILHVQADIVSGNLLTPRLAEGSGSAPVGKDHHIALMAHEKVVPPVAPVLRKRALGAAEGDFNGRVRLGRIKLRRVQNPCKHLLTVYGLNHAGLCLMMVQLAKNMVILKCNLPYCVVIHSHKFCGEIH